MTEHVVKQSKKAYEEYRKNISRAKDSIAESRTERVHGRKGSAAYNLDMAAYWRKQVVYWRNTYIGYLVRI